MLNSVTATFNGEDTQLATPPILNKGLVYIAPQVLEKLVGGEISWGDSSTFTLSFRGIGVRAAELIPTPSIEDMIANILKQRFFYDRLDITKPIYYAFYDIDGNGVDELFIDENPHGMYGAAFAFIYTFANGRPHEIAGRVNTGYAISYIDQDGYIYESADMSGVERYTISRISDDGMYLDVLDSWDTILDDGVSYNTDRFSSAGGGIMTSLDWRLLTLDDFDGWQIEYMKILSEYGDGSLEYSRQRYGATSISLIDVTNDGIPELAFIHLDELNPYLDNTWFTPVINFYIDSYSDGLVSRLVDIELFEGLASNPAWGVFYCNDGTLVVSSSNAGENFGYAHFMIYEGVMAGPLSRFVYFERDWVVYPDDVDRYTIDTINITSEQFEDELHQILGASDFKLVDGDFDHALSWNLQSNPGIINQVSLIMSLLYYLPH
jgi:hypothetical protein